MIMEIIPTIREEIVLSSGQITSLNLAFVSPETPLNFNGGTAGNIAFGISYLGSKSILFSVVGNDFQKSYGRLLEKMGVKLIVKTEQNDITARSYQITDKNNEQIIIWQPNAIRSLEKTSLLKQASKIELSEIAVIDFSPGSPTSTLKHMIEAAKFLPNCIKIFDPGQMVQLYTTDQFTSCLELADIIVLNDAETLKAKDRGLKKDKLMTDYPDLLLIETLGDKGADYYFPNGAKWHLGTVPNIDVLEPTGAGDAFRAGLIHAYLEGENWINAGKTGSALASLAIESYGGQSYGSKLKSVVDKRVISVPVKQIT